MSSERDSDNLFTGDIDPDVAELIGPDNEDGVPEFDDLFGDDGDAADLEELDTTVQSFTAPEKIEEQVKPFFADKEYYKKVLTDEGAIASRVHSIFSSFLSTQDPQERADARSRLVPAFWELASGIAAKVGSRMPMPKRLFMRYGVLLPTAISAEQRQLIAKIIFENQSTEPIYYVDEWLEAVANGRVNPSATDETKAPQKNDTQRVNALLEKTRGRYDAQMTVIRNHTQEIGSQESTLKERVEFLSNHDVRTDLENVMAPYNDGQRTAIGEINAIIRRLGILNKELTREIAELEKIQEHLDELREKEGEAGQSSSMDSKLSVTELQTIRQMAKLCVGRQGNHFPVLMKQYMRTNILDVTTRENLINTLIQVEYLDPEVFLRTFKQQTNRIIPNMILIPCYGDAGVCWEPFERFNRATSRGRLAIPMYPKDVRTAVVAALGDLRWQVAKEKAQHYWMEEGLTGWYYQWFSDKKMKGDVKDAFIQDYILWITKESEATQKLDRDVRGIFWRYIPFPQDIKEKLKNRGFVYSELFKKDQNRAISDGY